MTILLRPPQTRHMKIMPQSHVGETTKAHGWKSPNRGTHSGGCVTTSASTLWRRSAARSTGILPVAHHGQDGRATVITQTPSGDAQW